MTTLQPSSNLIPLSSNVQPPILPTSNFQPLTSDFRYNRPAIKMASQVPTPGFRTDTRSADGAVVVECHGNLTFQHAPQLRNKVRTLIPNEKCIILDLKEVPFMDSAGLGTIVTLYVSARTRGCKIELINISPALRTLLSMSNLLSLFEPVGRCGGKFP
jgi:anti-anti-sigma factor